MNSEKANTTRQARRFAENIDTDNLPRKQSYDIVAAYPMNPNETIIEDIQGYYHALYVRDRIKDEYGHIGVSFSVRESTS